MEIFQVFSLNINEHKLLCLCFLFNLPLNFLVLSHKNPKLQMTIKRNILCTTPVKILRKLVSFRKFAKIKFFFYFIF